MSKLDDAMTLKLPSELKRKLYGLAEAQGTEAAEIIRRLTADYIEAEERKFRALTSVFAGDGQ